MTPQRALLGLLAVVAGLMCAYIATSDVHFKDRTCGTPLFGSDPNKLVVTTGNPTEDEFAEEELTATCSHLVTGRRLLALAPLAVAIGAILKGQRLRDRPEPIAGNSIFGTGPPQ